MRTIEKQIWQATHSKKSFKAGHSRVEDDTPTIERQESRLESIILTAACIALFAFIGVLLAWRG